MIRFFARRFVCHRYCSGFTHVIKSQRGCVQPSLPWGKSARAQADPEILPALSKRIARELVVPWSIDIMYLRSNIQLRMQK